MKKKDIMKELIDRYEQLDSLDCCKSARIVLENYIKKLEMQLKEELKND